MGKSKRTSFGGSPVCVRRIPRRNAKENVEALPLQRGVDHEIELLPKARPLIKNAYRMAQPKLAEL